MSKAREKLSKVTSKKYRKWLILAGAAVVIALIFGYRKIHEMRTALPKGIASGNGRIQAREVDVASKNQLRVKEVLVAEGDLVKPGQIVVQMDTLTLQAELAEANEKVATAREQLAAARAAIAKRHAEVDLAKIEKKRSTALLQENAGSQREVDVRTMAVKTTAAGLTADEGNLHVAEAQVKVEEANVATIQTRIDDATLRAPVLGRVLYRLAEPGEVLAPGGKALTLINLQDVYMEIFLPSEQAAAVKMGSEARFTVDYEPNRVAPGYVSFVSPEAQFTPKEVETKSEREKLMFRVKIQVPQELVSHYIEHIKTGVRGEGYVKTNESVAWPERLQHNLVTPAAPPPSGVGPSPAPQKTQ
jgi:HlyD family secretion protein